MDNKLFVTGGDSVAFTSYCSPMSIASEGSEPVPESPTRALYRVSVVNRRSGDIQVHTIASRSAAAARDSVLIQTAVGTGGVDVDDYDLIVESVGALRPAIDSKDEKG